VTRRKRNFIGYRGRFDVNWTRKKKPFLPHHVNVHLIEFSQLDEGGVTFLRNVEHFTVQKPKIRTSSNEELPQKPEDKQYAFDCTVFNDSLPVIQCVQRTTIGIIHYHPITLLQ
jgi:hypothetical protein